MRSTTKLNTTYFISALGFNEKEIAPLLDLVLNLQTQSIIHGKGCIIPTRMAVVKYQVSCPEKIKDSVSQIKDKS